VLLEVKSISVYYDSIQALKGISLKVDEGELVTIVGSNGAGKTTTMMTISGILRPREGTVQYQGETITRLPPHEIVKRGISHCPEGRQIFTGRGLLVTWNGYSPSSQSWLNGAGNQPAHCRAASSRCWPWRGR
jgi:ABC-type branched-subunit amino acid transport system ATPase component